jgi:flagellar FliL protein
VAKKDEKDDEKEKKNAEGEEGSEEGGGEAAENGKNKPNKKMFIIIGAVVGLLVLGGGIGATLYFTGVLGKKDAAAEQTAAKDTGKGTAVFFSLGDILVNLSGEGKHPNFLKIKVSLELADEKDVPMMEAIKPRIIDNFQVYLRELRIEDLRGSAGLYRLREELLLRVTEAAQPIRVRDVLFQEMLVQ